MPKQICIQAPEVAMHGDISIHAKVAVVTRAKLDEITVKGNCECEDKPPVEKPRVEKPLVELVLLVDGSDSYNNKINDQGEEAFEQTLDVMGDLIKGISDTDRAVVSVIQFSGVKPKENEYSPGSAGKVDGIDLWHWRTIVSPKKLGRNAQSIIRDMKRAEYLDGNGQLFLCLQDLSMRQYLRDLDGAQSLAKNQDRQRILILFTDEEWDINNLQDGFGSGTTDRDTVAKHLHKAYDAVFPCIIRRDRDTPMNVAFVNDKLANGHKDRVNNIQTDNFKSSAGKAVKRILGQLKL